MSYQNTGRKIVNTLRQVNVYPNGDRIPTGVTKPNLPSDPDYIPPIENEFTDCPTTTTTTTLPPPPTCPDRVLVVQICNENSVIDDNFDIYLNGTKIGSVDLNQNDQIGSVFIASTDTALSIISSDFACPLSGMVEYFFNPNILLYGTNTIQMTNIQDNGHGNAGTVGIRNYLKTGEDLSSPCVVADLTYNGSSGQSFTMTFEYTECCPEDTTTIAP